MRRLFGAAVAFIAGASCGQEAGGGSCPERVILYDPTFVDPPKECVEPEVLAAACSIPNQICDQTDPCFSLSAQTEQYAKFRLSSIDLGSPRGAIVEPDDFVRAVSPRCLGGTEKLNILLWYDWTSKKLIIGGGYPLGSNGHFDFASGTAAVTPAICSTSNAVSMNVAPVVVPLIFDPENYLHPDSIPVLIIPIYGATVGAFVLHDVEIHGTYLNTCNRCIGSWNSADACSGKTGWKACAGFSAKIAVEDAERVSLSETTCQTLCATLALRPEDIEFGHCKRDARGVLLAKGDACLSGAGCGDAFDVGATFAASSVEIDNHP
jgi:hypothetical protein